MPGMTLLTPDRNSPRMQNAGWDYSDFSKPKNCVKCLLNLFLCKSHPVTPSSTGCDLTKNMGL